MEQHVSQLSGIKFWDDDPWALEPALQSLWSLVCKGDYFVQQAEATLHLNESYPMGINRL